MGAGRVIGSAGSPRKVRYLTGNLGFDAAFDHPDGPVPERLREAAPDGINVCFDKVGGACPGAAVEVMNPHDRIAVRRALSPGRAAAGPTRAPAAWCLSPANG